jgi:type II secretory pathway component PulK
MKNRHYNKNKGMALVSVIIFSAVAMIVITMAISLSILTAQANRQLLQGQQALHVAESGVENALMQLLRNPAYNQETLIIGNGTAIINVGTPNGQRTVNVVGTVGSATRTVEVVIDDTNGTMTVESWREIF